MMRLTRISSNARKRGILKLPSAPARYVKRKIVSAYKKLVEKEPRKTAEQMS